MEEREAIIIGGGPAGAVAAWRMAVAGWRVLMVERRTDGAAKCCGHCLHPDAFRVLDAMGVGDAVRRASLGRTRRGRVCLADDREVLDVRFARDLASDVASDVVGGGLIVPRRTFDAILRTAAACAGVDVRTDVAASVVAIDAGGAAVRLRGLGERHAPEETLRTSFLIGADGCGSAVARAAGLVETAAVGRKFGMAMDVAIDPVHCGDRFDDAITMFVVEGGYLGVVREGSDRLHCGALVAADAPMPTKPREALGWFIERSADLAAVVGPAWGDRVSHVVASGPMPWRTRARTTYRVALVGDAAGYIEPFTGEGMRWAIESGWLLGQAIGEGAWDARARERYEQAWMNEIAPMHRRCERVAAIAGASRMLAGVGAARRWMPSALRQLGDRALAPLVRALVPR